MSLSIQSTLSHLQGMISEISSTKIRGRLTELFDSKDFNLLFRQSVCVKDNAAIFNFLLSNREILKIDLYGIGKESGTVFHVAYKTNNLKVLKLLEDFTLPFDLAINKLQSQIPKDGFTETSTFIVTNEHSASDYLIEESEEQCEGTLFIGTSGLSALDLVTPSIDHILMVDISSRVKDFWRAIEPIIRASTDREDCASKLIERFINDYRDNGEQSSFLEFIQQDRIIPVRWLMDDRSFKVIWEIVKNRRFAFLQADFTNPKACKEIRNVLDRYELINRITYLSNIIEYTDKFKEYGMALEFLLNKKTMIVDVEPTPFKFTTKAYTIPSKSVKGLSRFLYFLLGVPNYQLPTIVQRSRMRNGESIEELYPIIKLAGSLSKDVDLFFEYGNEMGFFTKSEISDNEKYFLEKSNELARRKVSPQESVQAMIKIIGMRLYGSASGGGGGGKACLQK
jgi:hypothetical protein